MLVIPTQVELASARRVADRMWFDRQCVELCGFGPVVAAARTAQLLALHRPTEVLLLGVAGALDQRLAKATAVECQSVVLYGVGAGTGTEYSTTGQMNWLQWSPDWQRIPGSGPAGPTDRAGEVIGDRLELFSPSQAGMVGEQGRRGVELLTCCAASASPGDVELRLQKFPDAAIEDMEGFSVAVACRLADVPLRIIRGISNRAGDRDLRRWDIDGAMRAAIELAMRA